MAKVTVLCWQEIPSAVEAQQGRNRAKLQLSARFMELIDAIAMRRKLSGSDDYLAQWRREPRGEREGTPEAAAAAVAAELEADYETIRAAALAKGAE
ncbi:MAG: virulence factor [Phycisphaerae bacterium]